MALVNFQGNWNDESSITIEDMAKLTGEFEHLMEFGVVNMANKSLADISMKHCIKYSPTFVLFRNGRRVHQIGEGNQDALRICLTSFTGNELKWYFNDMT